MFLRVVESLPTLNPLQAATTEKAISILSTELPTNQRGLYLFRAVLKLILFKYRWEQGSYIAWMDLCQNRTSKLNVGISQLIGDFSDLSHDLKSAYPSHTEEIVAMVNYLREISEALDKPKDLNIKDPKTRQLLQALVLTIQARENTELKEVAACLGKI
jgi:hypothetical protein